MPLWGADGGGSAGASSAETICSALVPSLGRLHVGLPKLRLLPSLGLLEILNAEIRLNFSINHSR